MRASEVLFPAGIAAIVAVVAVQQWAHRAEMRAVEARMESLGKQVDEGRRSPGLEVRVVHEPSALPLKAAAPRPEERAEEEPAAIPAQPAAAPPDGAEMATRFAAAFRAEPVDAAWEAETRPRLQASLEAAGKATSARVRSTECHGSMCRVEVVHDDRGRLDSFFASLHAPDTRAWNGAMFTRVEPEGGQLVTTSYMFREGVALPSVSGED